MSNRALRDLRAIPRRLRSGIEAAAGALSSFPRSGGDVLKLQGREDAYRLRHGRFRIIFVLDKPNRQIVITRVVDRKDAY